MNCLQAERCTSTSTFGSIPKSSTRARRQSHRLKIVARQTCVVYQVVDACPIKHIIRPDSCALQIGERCAYVQRQYLHLCAIRLLAGCTHLLQHTNTSAAAFYSISRAYHGITNPLQGIAYCQKCHEHRVDGEAARVTCSVWGTGPAIALRCEQRVSDGRRVWQRRAPIALQVPVSNSTQCPSFRSYLMALVGR
jgi:hypothetical protein